MIRLPSSRELRCVDEVGLDASSPHVTHYLADLAARAGSVPSA